MKYTKITAYKYELYEDFTIMLPELTKYSFTHPYFIMQNGKLTVRKGYAWDGVSGPTVDTDNTFIAGLVHDTLYQSMRAKFMPITEKVTADNIFFRLLRENGMTWFRAEYFYLGVKWFGNSHVTPIDGGEEMDKVFQV